MGNEVSYLAFGPGSGAAPDGELGELGELGEFPASGPPRSARRITWLAPASLARIATLAMIGMT